MITLWNTATRELEEFQPLHPPNVGMYCCGPTVYNPATIGNLRSYVFEDVLRRTLETVGGFEVKHVMNITDVGHLVGDGDEGEDKVEREATKTGKSAWDIAREFETRFFQDLERLNVLRPTVTPRATDHIQDQVALIQELEAKGFTYQITDGIYFDTSKFPKYGSFSGQDLADKEEGARVEANPEKRNPSDFALWKFSPAGGKRQMEWESPWGVGFPGWHIECSAMSVKELGQPFDIHCGGVDHIPVHHENETAQSEAASGKPLARFWLHNEFLTVDGRRMGKSEGNAYTLDDVIVKGFDPLAFRLYCLGTHYRSKMNFTWEGMEAAQNALRKLQGIARGLDVGAGSPRPHRLGAATAPLRENWSDAMSDDLNTPQALAALWDVLKSDASDTEKSQVLSSIDRILGLGLTAVLGKPLEVPADVTALAQERELARQNKDWAKSDELRDQIKTKGWIVEDKKDGGYDLSPSSAS